MDDVQRCHDALLSQRTQIRHHPTIFHWMKRCWQVVPHSDPKSITVDEYEDMYSILLYEMTICWEEELNDAILVKMWKRDAGSHSTLNLERFCCSIFYFVEMWVEEITFAEYEKIFCHVYRVLSGLDLQTQQLHQLHARGASSNYRSQTFKPTLESFSSALDNEKAMEELHMNFGKSISFNAQQYYQHFGTPTTHLQAFQATLLQMQSRVRVEQSNECNGWNRPGSQGGRSPDQRGQSSRTPSKTNASPSARLNASRPPSALRHRTSNRSQYVLELSPLTHQAAQERTASPPSSPERTRTSASNSNIGGAFLLTGKSVLQSTADVSR